ncbi:MAG: hypothetical protein J0L97_02185 [Alphaproteobacteria bacterium]|nr:hypothetical protein [Alphaproteobacteria bacterium]
MLFLSDYFRNRLRIEYASAGLDIPAFTRRYSLCNLKDCQGLCCHEGCEPYEEETKVIKEQIIKQRVFFNSVGIDLSEPPFYVNEDNEERTRKVPYTYTVPIPSHFSHTACVFRDAKNRCSLQMLSLAEDKPSWWYKPLACWLHPIVLENHGEKIITIPDIENDDCAEPGYPGFSAFTPCGAEAPEGEPGYVILAHELAMLSELLDRDLLAEIKAAL